jgi:N-acetylglutamate synthase-like GNAT family acetyltransferase
MITLSNRAVTISDREIKKSELEAIYDDFKRIDIQNGISVIPQVRYQYLAEENGNIIGFASGLTNHKWFYLSDMWVTAEYRRQGLGTKLLRMLEEKVVSAGIEHIYTWTSGANNAAFYEKQGYYQFTVFEGFFEAEGFDHIGYRKDCDTEV